MRCSRSAIRSGVESGVIVVVDVIVVVVDVIDGSGVESGVDCPSDTATALVLIEPRDIEPRGDEPRGEGGIEPLWEISSSLSDVSCELSVYL